MKCKDCVCSDVCYYKAFNDVRAVKRRDDVEKVCKSFVHRDCVKAVKVETNFYDKEEIYPDCTVQVLTNTATGDVSVVGE